MLTKTEIRSDLEPPPARMESLAIDIYPRAATARYTIGEKVRMNENGLRNRHAGSAGPTSGVVTDFKFDLSRPLVEVSSGTHRGTYFLESWEKIS